MASVKVFGSQVNHQKIPILGLVAESATTAPASPVGGQFWYDTTATRMKVFENGAWVLSSLTGAELTANKGVASGYASLDGTTKVPIAQIPTGSTGTTVPFGNDARLSDTRVPTDASVTGGTAGAGVKIAANTITAANIANAVITDVQVAAANKDGVAGTASLRTLGTGAQQALAGSTRLDQITAPTAAVSLNNQLLSNLAAPVSANDAARLTDVQTASAGIDNKPSARAASTANVVVASGLVTTTVVDGVTLTTGDRVLLKNQTTATENGLYVVPAAGAASRTTDTLTANSFVFVEEGTVNADTQWMITNNGAIVIGTTSISWAQFGAPGSVSGTTNRITASAGVIDISAAYVGQTSLTTLGTVTTGVWNGTSIAVLNGGTGATTAAAARTNLGAVGKYAADLAALVAGVELTITHSLNSLDVIPSFRTNSDGQGLELAWRVTGVNTIVVQADLAYAASAVRVTVVG